MGRSGGLRRGAAALGCAGAQRGAARGRGKGLCRCSARGRAGAQQRGAAQECGVGPRMGVAWGREGARRGAAQGRSSVGLRRGVAARGCGGAVVGGGVVPPNWHLCPVPWAQTPVGGGYEAPGRLAPPAQQPARRCQASSASCRGGGRSGQCGAPPLSWRPALPA